MKKILYISLLGLLITSCGGDSKNASVDKAIESKDLILHFELQSSYVYVDALKR